eukprot:38134-Pelagomonas_calceolata.AAC.5
MHVEAYKRRWDVGNRARIGQLDVRSFVQARAPVQAASMQAESSSTDPVAPSDAEPMELDEGMQAGVAVYMTVTRPLHTMHPSHYPQHLPFQLARASSLTGGSYLPSSTHTAHSLAAAMEHHSA